MLLTCKLGDMNPRVSAQQSSVPPKDLDPNYLDISEVRQVPEYF